jgi:hypothetical protein
VIKVKKIKALIAILLVCCLAAGCTITLKNETPENDMVSAQKTARGNSIKASVPKENIQSAKNEMSAVFSKAQTAAKSGTAENSDWPSSSLPSGFPEYPEGEVIYFESYFDNDFMICVAETSKTSFDSYQKTLLAAGWIFSDPEDGMEMAYKESWMLTLAYDDECGTGIYLFDMGFDIEDLYKEAKWPQKLPVEIPEYTDGDIAFVSEYDDTVMITIDNTSKSKLDAYGRQAAEMGWKPDGASRLSMEADGGVWYLYFNFDADDNSAFISLMFMDESGSGANALEFTGWANDEFTKLIPKPDFEMSVGSLTDYTFMGVFPGVKVSMIKEYAEKVKAAGFTVNGIVTEETATTYTYTASNNSGYIVILRLFEGETMYITMANE